MSRIPIKSGYTLIPEGTYVFRIYDALYDETFGKIEIKLVNAKGMTHTERFSILKKNGEKNENALAAFGYLAHAALNDFSREDVDPEELIDRYIEAEVKHTIQPSTKKEGETVTFANLGMKTPAEGFTETPVPRALTLGRDKPEAGEAKTAADADALLPGGLDLDALLGG